VTDAIKAVRKDGRTVLIGLKRGEPIPGLVTDELIYKGVTVIGRDGRQLLQLRAGLPAHRARRGPDRAGEHAYFRARPGRAGHPILAGEVPGADAIGVSVEPGRA
jgi:hypothetical protein